MSLLTGMSPVETIPYRLGILEKEHQSVSSLKHKADLIVDKSYQVVSIEEHVKDL